MTPARGYTPSVEELHNDLAALTVLLRLATWGRAACEEHERNPQPEPNEDSNIARLYVDGAGGFEPDALVAWLKGEIERTENTIDGLEAGLGGVTE